MVKQGSNYERGRIIRTMVGISRVLGVSLVFLGAALAQDFNRDIANTSTIQSAIRDESEKSKTRDLLTTYADARKRVFIDLLDQLKRDTPEQNASNWNSQVGNGHSALSNLGGGLPPGVKDSFRDFLENEKRMWDSLRESPGFPFSRYQILTLTGKTTQATASLREKWLSIERQDAAHDDAIYRGQVDWRASIKNSSGFLVEVLGKLSGKAVPGDYGPAVQSTKEMIAHSVKALTLLKQETDIWKTFLNEREVARKIHEEIDFTKTDKAIEYARSLPNPGNREDFGTFKDLALRILDDHRNRGKTAYDTFIFENRSKFIGTLETKWFLTLIDEKEVMNYSELFELQSSELDSLIKKHEEGLSNVTDSSTRLALKEMLDKITSNSRESVANWKIGKQIYDDWQRELKRS